MKKFLSIAGNRVTPHGFNRYRHALFGRTCHGMRWGDLIGLG